MRFHSVLVIADDYANGAVILFGARISAQIEAVHFHQRSFCFRSARKTRENVNFPADA